MENPEITKLYEDVRIVLRYWRTIENWSPSDIEEARSALREAMSAGGPSLQDAMVYYAAKANEVRPQVVDQEPLSVSIPMPYKQAAKMRVADQSQMLLA